MDTDGCDLYGNWGKVGRILHGMPERINVTLEAEILGYCELVKNRLQTAIKDQTYGHVPLNPYYKAFKVRTGLDPRILIATGTYIDSFSVWKMAPNIYAVGIKPGTKNREGLNLSKLGIWLEFGTENMPARPHWRIEYAKVIKELPPQLGGMVISKAVKG